MPIAKDCLKRIHKSMCLKTINFYEMTLLNALKMLEKFIDLLKTFFFKHLNRRKHEKKISTYISDLPDFSQIFSASVLLLDAIFTTVNSLYLITLKSLPCE